MLHAQPVFKLLISISNPPSLRPKLNPLSRAMKLCFRHSSVLWIYSLLPMCFSCLLVFCFFFPQYFLIHPENNCWEYICWQINHLLTCEIPPALLVILEAFSFDYKLMLSLWFSLNSSPNNPHTSLLLKNSHSVLWLSISWGSTRSGWHIIVYKRGH